MARDIAASLENGGPSLVACGSIAAVSVAALATVANQVEYSDFDVKPSLPGFPKCVVRDFEE